MDPFADIEQKQEPGFDPRTFLRIFLRRKWLFIVPFFLCLAMAYVAIRTQTPIYFSSRQIRVIHEATSASTLPREVSRYSSRSRDREVFTNIELILTSPQFLEGVARELYFAGKLASDSTAASMEMIVSLGQDEEIRSLARKLGRKLRISQDGEQLFRIGVRDADPEQAFLLAEKILEAFLATEKTSRVNTATSWRDFLEKEMEDYQTKLTEAETRLAEYKRTMLVGNLRGNPINAQNLTGAESALSRLRAQFFNTDTSELFAAEQDVRAVLGRVPDAVRMGQDPEIGNVIRQLSGLEYDQALATPGAALDAELQSTLGGLRVRLTGLIDGWTARNFSDQGISARNRISRYLYLRSYRDARERALGRLEQHIVDFKNFTARQPDQSAELTRLQQEVDSEREMLQAIRRDIAAEEMKVRVTMSEIGYRIELRKAPHFPPRTPIEPDKVKLSFLGFILALGMGSGLVILAQLLDRSFHSVTEIERSLGLSVVGTLPVVENEFFQKQRLRRVWTWVGLTLGILGVAAAGLLFVYPRLS